LKLIPKLFQYHRQSFVGDLAINKFNSSFKIFHKSINNFIFIFDDLTSLNLQDCHLEPAYFEFIANSIPSSSSSSSSSSDKMNNLSRQPSHSKSSNFISHFHSASLISTSLAIAYSLLLHISLPTLDNHNHLIKLPLRHSSLFTLLPQIIAESFIISHLSLSTFNSFGACLHLLKIPLLSTVYLYFNVDFKNQISRSLIFDLVNYYGQFFIFYLLNSHSKFNFNQNHNHIHNHNQINQTQVKSKNKEINNTSDWELEKIFIASLSWILISLIDGITCYLYEKYLTDWIKSDIDSFIKKHELDQYFLLKSPSNNLHFEILRPKRLFQDKGMLKYQLISPLINLPYLFSSASLISLPADFILLDRLPMLSIHTKLRWILGLVIRRLINSSLSYFFQK
ncbi:hypothetical protein O181_104787, partial [Austropuccinia psidii MF-1]|nr:hypothetical protein [Austropuccinia psidii MF-1]